MKPFSVIAGMGIVLIVAYVLFAYLQAEKVPQVIDITTASAFKKVPPTVCTLGNSSNTVTGTLHIFNDYARFDIVSSLGISPIDVHLIVNRDDNVYFWQEASKTGAQGIYVEMYQTIGLGTITDVSCSPWWLPFGSFFVPPQEVSFNARL